MVQVLAINSSPLMDKGNTALILNPLLEGMKEAGAEVELVYTKILKINSCQGEFNCWHKTPGKCFQEDDMQMLYPKLRGADIWVLATPVYVDGLSGPMKNLLDRVIPLVQPTFELRDGHCRHPLREGSRRGQVVLVSNCGFWELDNFDPLLVHVKAVCKNANREFAGALLRPHGPALRPMRGMGLAVDDVFQAAQEAGRQLIRDRKMSPETLGIVSRELLPLEMYVQAANQESQRTEAGNPDED
jgi:multimeric flavodoxin WrbA